MIANNLPDRKTITQTYEDLRLANRREQFRRKDEINSKFPRIAAIEAELGNLRFTYMRDRIRNRDLTKQADFKEKTALLVREKEEILVANGYPKDYLHDIYTCPICEDTGSVNGARCKCYNQKVIDNLYEQSNLRGILARENFNTFDLSYYSKDAHNDMQFSPYENICNVVKKLKKYVAEFGKESAMKRNILFYGETGLGKTFLTNCVAKEILDNGHSVLYLSANDIFENLIGKYLINHEADLEDLYKLVYNCKLLIIDDLGTEYTNDFVRSQLFEIINKRELSGLATIISTNLNMSELDARYSQRVVSRIIDGYNIFNIYGHNIRYQKRKNSIM